MKIAIVSSTFPGSRPGGVPTYVEGLAAHMAHRATPLVLALGTPLSPGEVSLGPVEGFKYHAPLVWLRLFLALLRFRPDVIEVHNAPVGLPLFLFCRPRYFFHGPAVLEAKVEGASPSRLKIAGAVEAFVVRRSRRIVFASKTFRDLFRQLYPSVSPDRLRVRYPRMLFPAAQPLADTGRHFVCVRRLVARTGVDLLIEAFGKAVAAKLLPPDITLRIVGQGPERAALETIATSQTGAERIIFEGRVSLERRDELFATAIAQVVPTRELEGFGLVVLEAGVLGCPSLVTPVGALPEVIGLLDGHGVVAEPDAMPAALGRLAGTDAADDRATLAALVRRRFEARR